MAIKQKVKRHLDEAAYLYGFAKTYREAVGVTWYLTKRNAMQLAGVGISGARVGGDASVRLYGARHVVDVSGTEIYVLNEIYREHLYDKIADFVPSPGSTVVDVGANVGMFAVHQARRGARVYAFEPNPDCFRRLSKAVIANGMTARISIFNYAIGATIGIGALQIPNNRTVLGSVIPCDAGTMAPAAAVSITSLDHMLPALGVLKVDLLKIDTEGFEIEVLQGAVRTLQSTARVIVEYHSRGLQREVGDFFTRNGFQEALHLDTDALPESGLIYARRSDVPVRLESAPRDDSISPRLSAAVRN